MPRAIEVCLESAIAEPRVRISAQFYNFVCDQAQVKKRNGN